MSSIRCETRKRKIRVQCRRVCRDTQEGIPKRIYLLERISRSCSFPLLAYSRSCPIVFPFPLLHSRSLSCMRTCHNFCDRYYKPTETNLFFQAIRGHSVPEYRQIILCSCYRARMHSEFCFALQMSNYSSYFSRRVVIWQCDLWRRRNKRDSLGFSLVYTIYKLATVINKCERRLKRVDGLNSQWSRRVPMYSTAFVRLLTNHRYDSADADSDTDTDVPTPTPTPTPTRPLTLHITGKTLARIEINFRQQGETIEEKKEKEKISGICIQKHRTWNV